MSMFRYASAAALASMMAVPTTAMARPAFSDALNLGAGTLTDPELAGIYGRASPRAAFWNGAAREQATTFDQQNSVMVRVTFDNWFNDVGNALIWSNVLTDR